MTRFWAGLTFLLGLAASLLGFRLKQKEAESKMHKDRADQAQAVIETDVRIDENLQKLNEKQQERRKDEEKRLVNGERDHLDNDW